MDLFIDKYYEQEVEKKFDYYKLLYGTSDGASGLIIEGTPESSFRTGNVLFVKASTANIDAIRVKNSNIYLQEFRIANNLKKFII